MSMLRLPHCAPSARLMMCCAAATGAHFLDAERASAGVNLQGLSVFATDSNGSVNDTSHWNTVGGDLIYNAWVSHNGTWLNGTTDANAAITANLEPGEHTFEIWCEQTILRQNYALNLFFGNSLNLWAAPNISVYAPLWTGAAVPATQPNTSTSTRTLSGMLAPGAGSDSWIDPSSGLMISVSDWCFGGDHPLYRDRVGQYHRERSNRSDYVGRFTVTVAPIPAPGAAALALAACPIALRRRR